ncbi:fluoride efflux transporter FluC [Halomarina halobia]|uniref:Fluoride-specific ion channel FluC n=1 Tax=Halomarina halobia TaxID=3033386 RepID=A0ABD6AAK7_9EURY|nr:CrcB family protein [Halomarina sp. PSR21]
MTDTHPILRLESLALVAVGGFAGANARYLVGQFVPGALGTLAVNVLGSFLLGFLLYEAILGGFIGQETRAVLGTGVLSSFTTYSTFALETALLDSPLWMVGNVVATYGLGFAGVLLGRAVARALYGGAA